MRPSEPSVYPEPPQPRSHLYRRGVPVHHALRNPQLPVERPKSPERVGLGRDGRGNGSPLTTTTISTHTTPEVTSSAVLSTP